MLFPASPQVVFFDFFGVIQKDVFTDIYRHFGGDPVADADFIHDRMVRAHRGELASARAACAEHLGVTEKDWMHAQSRLARPDQDLLAFIQQLRGCGIRAGLITNMSAGQLPGFFAPEDPARYFDCIVVSGDVGVTKPSKGIYELAEQRLQVRPENCVMVDDSITNCEGARTAGMSAIRYISRETCIAELLKLLPEGIMARPAAARP